MIRKRPLCVTVLAVVILLLLLPSGIWMKSIPPESRTWADGLTGKIYRIEPRTEGQAVYLKTSKEKILIYFDAEQPFSIGNTIQIKPPYRIWEPEEPSNPGQFDARLYYQTQHITYLASGKNAILVKDGCFWPKELLRRLREELSRRCDRLFGEERSGVPKAMLLGDKTELDKDIKNIYQKSGMSHLLAISGLHISIIGMSLYRFLRKRGCSYGISGGMGFILVLLYGGMTGMSISTVRAVTMFGLAVLADFLGRSYDMLSALAAAALILLLEQPLYVRSASFLLSFGAVLGVGLVYPAFQSLFEVRSKPGSAFLVSLSIQLSTLPLIQWFYYEFPVYSVFLNLLVIPLMGALMLCGIAALGISFLSWRLAGLPALVCRVILGLYEWLGEGTLRLPGAVVICGKPKLWQILLYYGGMAGFVLWRSIVREKEKWGLCLRAAKGGEEKEETREEREQRRKKKRREKGTVTAIAVLLCICLQLRFHKGLCFTMLDVGQGDGLFLRTEEGTTCLIDGGSSDVKQVGRYRILPFLKERGVRRLDYVMVTHTDEDHILGIKELLEQAGEGGGIKIGALLLSKQSLKEEAGLKLRKLAVEAGTDVRIMKAGMTLEDKSTKICCLHPEDGTVYTDKNAGSLVLRLSYGEFSMLLTGDLEETGEGEILQREGEVTCDILKAGHHGSRFSTTEEWLTAAHPRLTLISCGEDNSYGHPHEETLERLQEVGSQVLVTTREGAITIYSDGKNFHAEGFVNDIYE